MGYNDGYKIWMKDSCNVFIKDPTRTIIISPRPISYKKEYVQVERPTSWYKKLVNKLILIYEKVKKSYYAYKSCENRSSHVLHKRRGSKNVFKHSRNDGLQQRYKKD